MDALSTAATAEPAGQPSAEPAAFPIDQPLPELRTPLSPGQILDRLTTASRRGRLAGFERGADGGSFSAALFSEPFDHLLTARLEPSTGGTIIRSQARMLKKNPVIFILVMAFTIWPGVRLTDAMIPGSWNWIPTAWWYLPITIIPLPWVWVKLMKKCRAAAGVSAHEVLTKVAAEVDGRLEVNPGPDR